MSRYDRQRYHRDQAELDARWRVGYDKYIAESPRWQRRRALVLQRANYICECCGVARARQAHHVTYDHVGNEPLWELRAVCIPCHDAITTMNHLRRIDEWNPWDTDWDPWWRPPEASPEALEKLVEALPNLRNGPSGEDSESF